MQRFDQRPEVRTFSVEQLIDLVRRGKLRPIARAGRWRPEQVRSLFESLYAGFPLGSLVLYRQAATAELVAFGAFSTQAPATPDALTILDGQQRLGHILGALLHPDRLPRGGLGAVWFDLQEETFFHLLQGNPPLTAIPLNVVVEHTRLLSWLGSWSLRSEREDLVTRAAELSRALREYLFPAYVLEPASPGLLHVMMKRLAMAGVQMPEHVVLDVVFGEKQNPLTTACERLDQETGFGRVLPVDFARCARAVSGRMDVLPGGTGEIDLVEATEPTFQALRRAMEFLVEDAGVPHLKLLSSMALLPWLVRFFHLFPDPVARTRELLSRWLWRGILGDRFALENRKTHRLFGAVLGNRGSRADEFQAISLLLDRQWIVDPLLNDRHHPTIPDSFSWFFDQDRRALAVVIALARLGPLDPETQEPLGNAELRVLLQEGKPRDFLQFLPGLDSMGGALLVRGEKPREAFARASAMVRKSHLLSNDSIEAFARGDAVEFSNLRSRDLDHYLSKFFGRKLGEDDNDRPPVESLLRQVDAALDGSP